MNWLRNTIQQTSRPLAQAPLVQQPPSVLVPRDSGDDAEESSTSNHPLRSITQKAIDVFLASRTDDGQIGGIGYWQVANGYTAIALHGLWARIRRNIPVLTYQISQVASRQDDFINEFNDDSMWWAMCLLEMHQLTHDRYYVSIAQRIWRHVRQFVIPKGKYQIGDEDMEGGVLWKSEPGTTQVNAITTGLFSELSARLAALEHNTGRREQYIHAAQLSLFWIQRCRYIPDEFLVLDTIDLKTHECKDWTFTYNTGQAMAASLAMYSALNIHHRHGASDSTSASNYLALACDMARHAMTRPGWVENDGTLTEPGAYPGGENKPAWQNDDAVGFKSVLLRSITKLYIVLQHEGKEEQLQSQIRTFVKWNFHSLQTRDTNGQGQYGPWWAGPMDLPTSHSQLAVLDVMSAIHAVEG